MTNKIFARQITSISFQQGIGNYFNQSLNLMLNNSPRSFSSKNDESHIDQKQTVSFPRAGHSTGDKNLDEAIRKWRQTNTPDDERFKKLFQKSESGLIKTLMDRKLDPPTEFAIAPKTIEKEALEKPSQPDEIDGPKGPEPTRFGDWESKGRAIDF